MGEAVQAVCTDVRTFPHKDRPSSSALAPISPVVDG